MKTFVPVLIAALALTMTFSTLSVAADTGADLFKAKCAMCHGPDGKGDTAMGKNLKVHDLGSADVQKQTDAELNGIITNGKGKMPKYDGKLTKEQITELVKFVRSLKK
jgi:mono/diheme cytochrome c family protein